MGIAAIIAAFAAYSCFSMVYVYRFRGNVHYDSVSEYIRKSWPIFAPLNCVLYLLTRSHARRPIMEPGAFPELVRIQESWREIREEALALFESGVFESTKNPESSAYYDIGFRTFYKYGWSKFYLRWYGHTHVSARRTCPRTTALLERVPGINGAMFSLLPPGGSLTRHSDPAACSLRYHLGLATPNDERCFINVDGRVHSWRDGEVLLFDETFLHFARNDSMEARIILMCDIDRPTYFPGGAVNAFYKALMRLTLVPNTAEDRRGFANRVYAWTAPLLARARRLKSTHRARYRLLKYSVNSVLLLLVVGAVGGIAAGLLSLADALG